MPRICELADLPNVSVGVIRAGTRTAVGLVDQFHLYIGLDHGVPGDRIDMVILETLTSGIVITHPAEIDDYRKCFAWLRQAADFGPDAIRRVHGRRR